MKKWNEEDVLKAIDLLKQNKNYSQIGEELNRTGKSVKVKLSKIGYRLTDFTIKNIKHCLNCNCEIENYGEKFCSQSCSATFNNRLRSERIKTDSLNEKRNERKRREYHTRKQKKCLSCDKVTTNKFCDSICQAQYRQDIIFSKIENGDITLPTQHYKKYLIYKHGEKCMECGWCEINLVSQKVPIELEHIDGNSDNNSLDNLKLLCPNCHSLTPTYKALNIGNGRHSRMIRYKEGKSF